MKQKSATVQHAELFGRRKDKYQWLACNDVKDTDWSKVTPNSPYYFLVPKNESTRKEYETYPKTNDIYPINVAGIITARDSFVIDFDDKILLKHISEMRNENISTDELRRTYFSGRGSSKYLAGDSRGWKLINARKEVRGDQEWKQRLQDIAYRPFDIRRIYYTPWMIDWGREEVMQHMLTGTNVAICTCRQLAKSGWEHSFVTKTISDDCYVSNRTRERGYIYPLYLYPTGEGLFADSPWPAGRDGRRPNLSKEFVDEFAGRVKLKFVSDGKGDLKTTFGPEDVFHYMYAVFHSPTYRSRYAEFLKIDFPRLPVTTDVKLLRKLCSLGERLVKLHLLEEVPKSDVQFPVAGDNEVDKPHYTEPGTAGDTGRVYINKAQYFDHVPAEVWEFHVGGYQVCPKWLKDRKGRQLTYDDITHYRNIVAALGETVTLMSAVDETIPAWPIP